MTPDGHAGRRDAPASSLPPLADPRWRVAPRHLTGVPTEYLPFAPPFVPSVGARLHRLRQATRLVMLRDGFPGRLRDGHVMVHPLDGRYLLEALLAEQAEHPRRHLGPAIARTAAAIIGRADRVRDALVMRYMDTASSMVAGRAHPSALAQAYYAAALARAGVMLGDDQLLVAADRFFAGLVRPVESGGTMYRTGGDAIPALVPTQPRDLVLNGWLSSLVAMNEYAEIRDSAAARSVLAASLRALVRMLPKYDVPELHLSRYGLTGPLLLRIGITGTATGVRISRVRVAVPGEGEQTLPVRSGSRWTPRAYPEDAIAEKGRAGGETVLPRARGVRLVAILSRAPYPKPNRLRFHIGLTEPRTISVAAHIGRYDPGTSATIERSWVPLAARELRAGSHDIDVPLPYEDIGLSAYPTNFTRGGPDVRANTYHATHIVRLRQLAQLSGLQELAYWADRWTEYASHWPEHPAYADGVCWSPEGEV